MIKLQEVYLRTAIATRENHDGSPNIATKKVYQRRDCLLNPQYIVAAYDHEFTSSMDLKMLEGQFPTDTQFTRIILDGNSFRSSEITVVGSLDKITQELK